MPKPSSSSAHVTYLDVAAAVEELSVAAQGLCETSAHVTAIVLFGSLADGSATPSSDADLLVVLQNDQRRVIDRVPDYGRVFEGLSIPAQIFPWTEAELADRIADGDPLALEIVRTGKPLAGTLRWMEER